MSTTVKTVVLALYLVAVVVGGLYSGRKTKNTKQFFKGSGDMPWYVIGGNLISAIVGGGTVVGYVGSFFGEGMVWYLVPFGCVAGAFVMIFFAEKINIIGTSSVGELLDLRFGTGTRLASSIVYLVGEMAIVVSMIVAMSNTLAAATGIDIAALRIVCAVVFAITASMGGIKGVATTNALLAFVIATGMATIAVLSMIRVGGFGGLSAGLPEGHLNIFSGNIPLATMLGNMVSVVCLNLVLQSGFYQNVAACRTPKDAKKAQALYGSGMLLIMGICVPLMGLAGRILLPIDTPQDQVSPTLAETVAIPVFALVFTAILLSAILSTANAMLLSTSMSFTNNILPILSGREFGEKTKMLVARIFIVCAAAVGVIIATFFPSVISLTLLTYTALSIMVVPIFCGLYWKKGGSMSGWMGILVGGIFIFIWELLGKPYGIHSSLIGIPLTFLTYLLFAQIGPKPTEKQLEIVEQLQAKKVKA